MLLSEIPKSEVLSKIRRSRPALGTLVEITIAGAPETTLHSAIEAGFRAIDRVQRLMSFHEATSDLQRLHREAVQKPVEVDTWTWQVLSTAQEVADVSAGIFDPTIASHLQRLRYLPGRALRGKDRADWKDWSLLPGNRVRFHRPLRLDLGGIAKGFAVDQACTALQKMGVTQGIVNAGGDLRVFGTQTQKIHLRHPGSPQSMGGEISLSDQALATSGIYFSKKIFRGKPVSPLLDGRSLSSCLHERSYSVFHREAILADALTKIVAVLGEEASSILKHYQAVAFCLDAASSPVLL